MGLSGGGFRFGGLYSAILYKFYANTEKISHKMNFLLILIPPFSHSDGKDIFRG